jgi:hypothetical protein
MMRVPRSRGAFSGLLLLLLGAWGALVPFVGPYFHYAFTSERTWAYTSGRLWLEILPGVVAMIGGLIVLASASRPIAALGAGMAVLAGAWFVVGRPLSAWPAAHIPSVGAPVGSALMRTVEDIGYFTGLGAVIVFLAAFALGRFAVIGAREAARAESLADGGRAGDGGTAAGRSARDTEVDTDAVETSLGRRVASAKNRLTSSHIPGDS